jgi:PAS domain S-box-containing protein
MIILDVLYNLAILTAASVLAGFIDNRWKRTTITGVVLQGLLFGGVAMLAMLKPFTFTEGIIFDGRSVVLSLGALFFGPVAGTIAGAIAVITRLAIGGGGAIMGISVIASSVIIGILFHLQRKREAFNIKASYLLKFGLIVHVVMIFLMGTLPSEMRLETLQTVGITVILAYPLATVIIGKILSDQENKIQLISKLSASENKFRGLVESAFDAIYLMKNRNYSYVNPRFCELTGYSEKELTSGDFDFKQLLTPKSLEVIENRYKQREEGKPVTPQYETQIMTKEGKIREVEVSTVALQNGHDIEIMGIMRDVTERKEFERKLSERSRELAQLNEEKDKLFSIISHDLRGPFGAFAGMLELMADEKEQFSAGQLREFSAKLLKSADSQNRLLNNLLDWSRLKRGITSLNYSSIDLGELIEECINEFQAIALQKEIRINNHIAEGLKVYADENMLSTVYRNLIYNAIKFSYRGGEIAIESKLANGCVQSSVSDKGIGMDSETLHNLFKPVNNLPTPGTEGEPSTGLGLIICKEFIEKHGGKIWAERKAGKGSVFLFTLPLK